jgi:hypothetical protein
VLVNLRSPTMGETSAMVVRALSLGKPLVVSDVGWFSELPDEVAVKVPVDEGETAGLVHALERLAGDPVYRERMGKAAADWARRGTTCIGRRRPHRVALEESPVSRTSSMRSSSVARAAAELESKPDSARAGRRRQRMGEVGLGRD